MVQYDYENLFYENEGVQVVIVNSGATVTGVENDAPTISGADFIITEEDVSLEDFDLREKLNSGQNLKFGSMEASYLQFSMVTRDGIPNLKDLEICVYFYFDDDSSTLFQVGRYIVKEDKSSADRTTRTISAYDVLNYLRDYDITEWYNKLFERTDLVTIGSARNSLFTWLAQDIDDYTVEQESTTLINDSFYIEKGIQSDVITFGFFMQRIAEFNGVFLHVGRNGKIKYIQMEWYDKPAKKVLDEDLRIPPTPYEDVTVWGIGYVVVYDRNNIRIAKRGSTTRKHPSNYKIIDSFIFENNCKRMNWKTDVETALDKLREAITHLRYKPCQIECLGNLCLEVGDRIDISYELDSDDDEEPVVKTLYTYILERRFTGIQGFTDVYSANGDKKQPRYKITNDRWHVTDKQEESTSGEGTDGVSEITNSNVDEMIEYWRNIGIRLLDEPTNVNVLYQKESGSHWVELYWTDPPNITNERPEKCEWLGTVVIRKEDEPPKHRWDGELIVNSTTRDEYSETPYIDDTIDVNKKYYYGIFPYHRHLTDADNNINFYRFTKVVSVNTEMYLIAPEITNLSVDVTTVTMTYNVPALSYGSYTDCRLVYKKNGIPNTLDDGTVVTLNPSQTSKTITGLDDDSTYFFMIFVEDSDGNTASSDPEDITTSHFEEDDYSYTGAIQTFTAPKTGIYQLETWGAQGGNATDGTNTARGGYGAYATGEVFLQQGDILYIAVGGQNGYNGGGSVN